MPRSCDASSGLTTTASRVDETGRPKKLRHKEWFDPDEEPFEHYRDAFAPLVWQCRYSGIEVPDALWRYAEFGNGKPYSDNQAEDIEAETFRELDAWVQRLRRARRAQGQVPPGRWRAARTLRAAVTPLGGPQTEAAGAAARGIEAEAGRVDQSSSRRVSQFLTTRRLAGSPKIRPT